MKTVIFAGGTGSVALQTGLVVLFGPNVEYSVITNLYDNGLSTGACRTVMDGEILGPSDLRKNQILRHKLIHGNTVLSEFLDKRITQSRDEIEDYLIASMAQLPISRESHDIMLNGILTFFEQPKSHEIEYVDFSIANIIYSGLARENGNSMAIAGKLMAKVLEIPEDAVICSSDESLYLTAKTSKGHVILDEGDIVEWKNPDDKIVSVDLVDINGKSIPPVLSQEAKQVIVNASLIIFSSGTQWSSLIPTYEHLGFRTAIDASKAKQYLVMNITQDKDMFGVDGNEFLDTLSKYLRLDLLTVIAPFHGVMAPADRDGVEIIQGSEQESLSKRHNPEKLVKQIFKHYLKDVINADHICFDYDDTLVARDGRFSEISEENVDLLVKIQTDRFSICSGNSARSILQKSPKLKDVAIYSERGANLTVDGHVELSLLNYVFDDGEIGIIIDRLHDAGIPTSKIQNRNNTIIAIKPVSPEYRAIVFNLLTYMFPSYKICLAGKTTVEISKGGLHKGLITQTWFANKKLAYIGDEYADGNDSPLFKDPKVIFVPINSVYTTNQLLRVLSWRN